MKISSKKLLRGAILFTLGLILLTFIFYNNIIDNLTENTISYLVVNAFYRIFGKMTIFIGLSSLIFGLVELCTFKMKLKMDRNKIIAYFVLFLSLSIFFIARSVVEPLSQDTVGVTKELFEVGYNKESGGLIGALFALPLMRYIHTAWIEVLFVLISIICILILSKELLIFIGEIFKELIEYYKSDEYKENKKILKAKKLKEKEETRQLFSEYKLKFKEKIIDEVKGKSEIKLSKKPKNNIFEKTKLYSELELAEKKEEWNNYSENKKNEEKKITLMGEKPDTQENKQEFLPEDFSNEINIEETIEEEIIKNKEEIEEKIVEKDNKDEQIEKNINDNEKKEVNKIVETNKLESSLKETNKKDDELNSMTIEDIFVEKEQDLEKKKEIEKSIKENVKHLEDVLKEFGIDAKVVDYQRGPTITRYELTIPKGIRVSSITRLSDDIAMNLAAESIRIEAPIPGKNAIGIETPNKIKEPVHFSNIIRNKELEKEGLNFILGRNIVGKDKILDITKTPHLLIAGQTGAGKSVCINTLVSSLISKKTPEDVRFIMVDPKMVELMPYNDIPHLLLPVIIDPKMASIALKWAVNEMEQRYRILMETEVRNINGYNSIKGIEKMPYIVIIIDELADLMMVAPGTVEESIARIAQKARAVGIHLVVATQRPSTDVVTGMIKANLPSRISFALRSQIDSRTILDSMGAEKLLGKGDMLLLENGSSILERIQGAFISDEEVTKLTNLLKSNQKVQYNEDILIETEEEMGKDELYDEAVELMKESKRKDEKPSISLIQRKLKVGFNRASRIYEQLVEYGVINEDKEILIEIE